MQFVATLVVGVSLLSFHGAISFTLLDRHLRYTDTAVNEANETAVDGVNMTHTIEVNVISCYQALECILDQPELRDVMGDIGKLKFKKVAVADRMDDFCEAADTSADSCMDLLPDDCPEQSVEFNQHLADMVHYVCASSYELLDYTDCWEGKFQSEMHKCVAGVVEGGHLQCFETTIATLPGCTVEAQAFFMEFARTVSGQ